MDISTAIATNARTPLLIPEPSGRNEALHPSVVFAPDGWNGYRYWMLYTPYDFTQASNENPHVDVSNDGQTWIQAPGVTNPIEPWPGTGYNSDTDLVLGPDNTMYAFWRAAIGVMEQIYYRTSTDGTNWVNKTLALQVSAFQRHLLSPAVIYDGTTWWMWTVNSQVQPGVVGVVEMWKATSPSGPWIGPIQTDLTAPVGRQPWHTEVRSVGDRFVQLVLVTDIGSNTNGVLYLSSSTNGVNWTPLGSPALSGTYKPTWDSTLYRSTFVPIVCDDSLKLAIWYTGRAGEDLVGYTEATFAGVIPPNATTYYVSAADLQDGSGNLAATNSVAVLVADTDNNGFISPQPNFPLSLGATWGGNNIVVGLWDLSADGISGLLDGVTAVTNTHGFVPGQKLQLYWFPSLTLASNTVGFTYYGQYTDTNNPPMDGSDPWALTTNASAHLWFKTASESGSNPDGAGRATFFTAPPPMASFTLSPATLKSPVTLRDLSTGYITNRFWDFGDGTTLNATATTVTHAYAPGTYTVTLVESGPAGTSMEIQTNLVVVLSPFQNWQLQYFQCTNCGQADANADPDGDGFTNLEEFQAGTDPTTASSSPLQITAIAPQGSDILLTWITAGGKTNVVQATTAPASVCASNFTDISPVIVSSGDGLTSTNYLDAGAATNTPSRYYRVRLVP
ncbi:MAG TPA: PKD domain-containing protein [Verrucomicrobiae bacterium]|nr:PKD domain-containing protein [Verrucomicrobiae bacterium]